MSLRRPLWAAREAWRALSAPLAGAQEDFVQAEGLLGSLEMRLPILEVAPFAGVAVPEPEEGVGVVAGAGGGRAGVVAGAGASRGGRAGVGLSGQQGQQRQQGLQGQKGRPGRREWERQPEREGRESPPGASAAPARAAEAAPVPRLSLRRPGVEVGAAAVPAPVAPQPVSTPVAPAIPASAARVVPASARPAGDLLAELTRELWEREMPVPGSGGRRPHPPTPSPIAHPSTRERGRPLPKTQEEDGQRFFGGRQEFREIGRELSVDGSEEERSHDDGRGFPLSRGLGVRWERGPGGEVPGLEQAALPATAPERPPLRPFPGNLPADFPNDRPGIPGTRPSLPDPDEARRLADLVNEALVEQARRHGVDLS